MPRPLPHCDICGRSSHSSVYSIDKRVATQARHLCRAHAWHFEPIESDLRAGIDGTFARYDLARIYLNYEDDRYQIRLDSLESSGRPIYIETGFIEATLVYHSLDRSLAVPTTHKLCVALIHAASLSISRLVIDGFAAQSRAFSAHLVLGGGAELHVGCRVTDGVGIAIVSNCDIHVLGQVEASAYAGTASNPEF